MGLTRSSSGLLVRDDFGSDSSASYTALDSVASTSWTFSGGYWTQGTAGKVGMKRRNSLTTAKCVTVRAKANAASGINLGCFCYTGTPGDTGSIYPGYYIVADQGDAAIVLYKRAGNAWTSLATTSITAPASGTLYYMRVHVVGTTVYGKYGATALSTAISATDSTYTSGSAALRATGSVSYDFLDARTAATITCSGVPTGNYLRVSDGTTAAEAQESSGTATVDAGAVLFPLSSVQIRTASGGGGSLVAELTSTDLTDMGGGDAFAYSADGTTYATRLFATQYHNPLLIGGCVG